MRAPIALCTLLLVGCPGSLGMVVLSAAVNEPQKGYVHPPNAKDYASWMKVSKLQLETHSQFTLLPRETKPISDGSEMWIYRHCPKKGPVSAEECCLYQFVIRDGLIASYRTAGTCGVNCSMRPESVVQACINDTIVPAGYGAH